MLNQKSRRRVAALSALFMLAGAGTTGTALARTDFLATLNGDNLPGGGDSDGWGRVQVEISDTRNRLCADLEVRSIAEVTSAQVYRGGPGEPGEPVASLERPRGDNDSWDCKEIGAALAQEIQSNPSAFYVSVATAEFPNGAIRGQLGPAG